MILGPHNGSQGALDMGLAPDVLPGGAPVGDAAARAPFEQQWGGALPTAPGMTAIEILQAAADGRVKALWIASDEWIRSAPDRALAEKALATAELVVVNELFFTATAQRAHVVFPVAAFAEKEGVVVNGERRLQKSNRVLSPRRGTKPDWEVFQLVAQALGANWRYRTAEDVWREVQRVVPALQGLGWAMLMPLGPQWSSAPRVAASVAPALASSSATGEGLWLLAGGTLFAQGSLGARAETLAKLAGAARAFLNPGEASRLGLAAGDHVELTGPAGALSLPAEADDSVPPGAVFVPYALVEPGLNVLGAPKGAGLRVQVRKAARAEKAHA
jgi:predicted molibdopterin-dependent oxidoreductase YjgC